MTKMPFIPIGPILSDGITRGRIPRMTVIVEAIYKRESTV